MKRIAIVLAFALFLLLPTTVDAEECRFVLGFKTLRDLIGHDIVGECLENEHSNAAGNREQQTTGGLLVWRKADNWTAFTDGYRTWINGPNGLEQRLNTERFPWEPDYVAPPTPTPVSVSAPTPSTGPTVSVEQALQTIQTLPQARRDPGIVDELRRLARISQPLFWSFLGQAGNDPQSGLQIKYIADIAQIDRTTALQIVQMPFMSTPIQGDDYAVLTHASRLAKSDLTSLQRILSHPKLHGGITDDHITNFVLLVLGLEHPDVAAAIEALPWVQDGVGRRPFNNQGSVREEPENLEEETVLTMVRMAANSPKAVKALAAKPWLQDGLAEWERQTIIRLSVISDGDAASALKLVGMPFLESVSASDYAILLTLDTALWYGSSGWLGLRRLLAHPALRGGITDDHLAPVILAHFDLLDPELGAAFGALRWVQDGTSRVELETIMAAHGIAVDSPAALLSLTQKPWMQDGISLDERNLLRSLDDFPGSETLRLVTMPFLETVHDADTAAVRSLTGVASWLGEDYLKEVLDHPTLRSGITDDKARLVAVLYNVAEHRPDLMSTMLDPEQGLVEERKIVLPRGGETFLTVVRTAPGSPRTMDLLEEVVRFHEEFMLEAFPKRFLGVLVFDSVPFGGEAHQRGTITIGNDENYGLIAHEVAHSYWVSLPLWIAEGAATFLDRVAVNAREGIPIRRYSKGDCPIADTLLAYEQYEIPPGEEFNRDCSYSLGAGLFVDLYHGLGDWTFRQGFRRLYVIIRDHEHSEECSGPDLGLCIVNAAFVTDAASPEAAAIADPIINRWYYGSPTGAP